MRLGDKSKSNIRYGHETTARVSRNCGLCGTGIGAGEKVYWWGGRTRRGRLIDGAWCCYPCHVKCKDEGMTTERPRDELWDELVKLCGGESDTMTKSERGKYNKALKELKDVGATPDDLRTRVRVYRQRWPHISVTPMALVMHWSSLKPEPSRYVQVVRAEASDTDPLLSPEQRRENLKRFNKLIEDVMHGTDE